MNVSQWYNGEFIKGKRGARGNDAVFIVQDVTDADNFTSVVDILTHVDDEQVFFFIVGRYADFSVPNAPFQFPNFKQLSEDIPGEDARECRVDSKLAQQDGMRRMITVLQKLGLYDKITAFICDKSFIPTQKPPLAHTMHVLDFLFDRKDLITFEDGTLGTMGDILTQNEYIQLLNKYNRINGVPLVDANREISRSEERRGIIRNVLESGLRQFEKPSNVYTLQKAQENVMGQAFDQVTVFLLAPLTGSVPLLQSIQTGHPITVYGQLFALNNLDVKSANIFLNQFNVDCDQEASIAFCNEVTSNPDRYKVVLCPTEVTKLNPDHAKVEKKLLKPVAQSASFEQEPLLLQIYTLYCRAKKTQAVVFETDTYVTEPQYDIDATRLFKKQNKVTTIPVTIAWKPLCEYEGLNTSRGSDAYLQLDRNGDAQRLGFKMEEAEHDTNIFAIVPTTSMEDEWVERLTDALQYRG